MASDTAGKASQRKCVVVAEWVEWFSMTAGKKAEELNMAIAIVLPSQPCQTSVLGDMGQGEEKTAVDEHQGGMDGDNITHGSMGQDGLHLRVLRAGQWPWRARCL